MRRVWMLLVAVLLLAGAVGCSDVRMNARYSTLLDDTVDLSRTTADRALAGDLTPAEMAAALDKQAAVWKQFKDARDAKAEEGDPSP